MEKGEGGGVNKFLGRKGGGGYLKEGGLIED